MYKKLVSIFLVLMILILPATSFANSNVNMKVQYLIDNKIVEGRTTDEEGVVDFALDKSITRAETTKLLVYILGLEDLAENIKGAAQAFEDVSFDHWANGYINVTTTERKDVAYGRRIIVGFPDGNFLPEKDITYNELATMLVRIVKDDLTEDMEDDAIWATSYIKWAKELGLLEDVSFTDSRDYINREDAFVMVYNAMDLLNKTTENKVDFKEELGIVSKIVPGFIELNQDRDSVYRLNSNTKATDGTTFRDLFENDIQPGSLVRLITDKDKNVEFIVELGNPRDLAIENRWSGVAEKTVSSKDNTRFLENYTETYIVNVGGIEGEINKDTRIFAADLKNNALKEVRALAEVFEMYDKYRAPIDSVYMGYDEFSSHNEVKVIVFGEVEKFLGNEEVRRIMTPVGSNMRFSAQSMIGGLTKVFSIEELNHFPSDYGLDYLDVILMRFESYDEPMLRSIPQVLIDHSEAGIFEVIELDSKVIVLEDIYGYKFPFNIRETAKFTEGELKVGSHVQLAFMPPRFIVDIIGQDNLENLTDLENIDFQKLLQEINLERAIAIIKDIDQISDFTFDAVALSVVDEPMRGALPLGIRSGEETGYIKDLVGDSVTIVDKENAREVNVRSYKVAPTDLAMARIAHQYGFEIVFDKDTKFGDTDYIYNISYFFNYERMYGSPMDDWIFNTMKQSIGNTWTIENLEEAYGKFNYIINSQNRYPIFFLNEEIIIYAVESYNRANERLGGPGRISLPPDYIINWSK